MRLAAFLSMVVCIAPACAQEPLFHLAPGAPITAPEAPALVAAGHLSSDEHVDIVVANTDPPSISTLLGDGHGGFAPSGSRPVDLPFEPTEMVVADLDGNGVLDVVVGNHDSPELHLFFGNGGGGFEAHPTIVRLRSDDHAHNHGLALEDVNADGRVDIVAVDNSESEVTVLLGKGKRRFEPAADSPFPVESSPYPLAVGDLNADGFLDVAVPSSVRSEGRVTLLAGDGAGRFVRSTLTVGTPGPWYCAIGDVNGDGRADLIVSHVERRQLSVLTSPRGSLDFKEVSGSPFDMAGAAWWISIVDLDGDGHADVAGAAGDRVAVMLGDGSGRLRQAPGPSLGIGRGAWRLAVSDVNADGKPDILTANPDSRDISVLLAR